MDTDTRPHFTNVRREWSGTATQWRVSCSACSLFQRFDDEHKAHEAAAKHRIATTGKAD